MEDEWISQNEYMRRFHCGHQDIQRMIENNEIEYRRTKGGHYKIRIGGNTVSREVYEHEKEKRIRAETKLKLALKILEEGVNTNEKN